MYDDVHKSGLYFKTSKVVTKSGVAKVFVVLTKGGRISLDLFK